MTNQYHILSFMPAVEGWEMPPTLEELAQAIVRSGKLRITTDSARNFVKFGTSDSDLTFSVRQLTDLDLLGDTRAAIARHVPPALGTQGIEEKLEQMRGELKRAGLMAPDKEIRVARVLAQSAHPAVIVRALEVGAELYVSHSHNVADLMAMHFWDSYGTASGLQSTEDEAAAVYVSCGGDPFFEGEQKTYETDGFPALARMVIIAGQELGHFADLIHTADGIMGRFSTDNRSAKLRASDSVRRARRADMRCVAELSQYLNRHGLRGLVRAESGVAFYTTKRLRFSPPWAFYQLWRVIAWLLFVLRAKQRPRLSIMPYHRCGEALTMYLADMAFNLAPDADAYRRPDPEEEEAIACIEALARVPQQVHKWGYEAVALTWPELTRIYYGTVIRHIEEVVSTPQIPIIINIIQQFIIFIRRRVRARPGYYP